MGVTREVVTITPSVAQSMLDTIDVNRDPTQSFEDLHVRQMEAGMWDDDITFVIIDEHGRLIDTAKRLRALIRAGYTGQWLVVSGVKATAQDKIDIGETRTVAQALQMKGVANPNECGSFARVMWDWRWRDSRGISKGVRPPPYEIVSLVLKDRKGFTNAVPVAKSVKYALPALRQPVIGGLYYLLSTKHPDIRDSEGNVKKDGLATRFFKELKAPPSTEPGNPARVLNGWLKRHEEEGRPSATAGLWLLTETWRRYVTYQTSDRPNHMTPSMLTYPGGKRTPSMADIPPIEDL